MNLLFSSIPFLYYFLPGVLLLYFLVPQRGRNLVLLLASLLFYTWGEPKYVLVMLVAVVCAYGLGLLIARYRTHRCSKIFLELSVIFSVVMLGYFKYADFFVENINRATGLSIPLLRIALPIGISFYTFQILSYTIDVYRGNVPVQKNLINFATYVTMFPQLIAGPIVRYSDIAEQLSGRTHSFDKAAVGIRRFVLGLSKKVLIANSLGELCEIFRSSDDKSILFYWLYAVAFTLHIYFDFSGYSDMAIGLGKILGFDFIENFNYPYISGSITEFWRRWHMSLGSWFRDYVYIPLGGNRTSKAGWLRNILIVWFLTGFWHGASWNFIVWGLYFALILVIEKIWMLPYLKKARLLNHVYVMLLVSLGFVIFNGTNLSEAFAYISAMFGIGDIPLISVEMVYYLRSYLIVLLLAVVGATPIWEKIVSALRTKRKAEMCFCILEPIILAVLMLLVTAYLVDGSFNPFLYFRF